MGTVEAIVLPARARGTATRTRNSGARAGFYLPSRQENGTSNTLANHLSIDLDKNEGHGMYISNPRTPHPMLSSRLRKEIGNWRELTPGDTVVLLTSDKRNPRIMGRVDDISDDGRYLWLLQDSCAGRRLLDRAEGYTTFLDSKL
ncbi:hypothetical protein ACIP9X_14305 [Arthrobacter sp. NPDC093125]|uniref:hypothetical protein n=1 Tax=Arthrobacter sp. NPDC093125 TaxID=3363944 RepID=UPI003824BA6B